MVCTCFLLVIVMSEQTHDCVLHVYCGLFAFFVMDNFNLHLLIIIVFMYIQEDQVAPGESPVYGNVEPDQPPVPPRQRSTYISSTSSQSGPPIPPRQPR